MLSYKLDPEEQELSDSLENGEWVSVENAEELKKKLVEAARFTRLKKEKEIEVKSL